MKREDAHAAAAVARACPWCVEQARAIRDEFHKRGITLMFNSGNRAFLAGRLDAVTYKDRALVEAKHKVLLTLKRDLMAGIVIDHPGISEWNEDALTGPRVEWRCPVCDYAESEPVDDGD